MKINNMESVKFPPTDFRGVSCQKIVHLFLSINHCVTEFCLIIDI